MHMYDTTYGQPSADNITLHNIGFNNWCELYIPSTSNKSRTKYYNFNVYRLVYRPKTDVKSIMKI